MSNEKFTKGPWSVTVDFDSYHEVGPYGERQTMITCDHNKYIGVDREQALANAHLIAAAPEMYDFIETYMRGHQEAELLLAKARGDK